MNFPKGVFLRNLDYYPGRQFWKSVQSSSFDDNLPAAIKHCTMAVHLVSSVATFNPSRNHAPLSQIFPEFQIIKKHWNKRNTEP